MKIRFAALLAVLLQVPFVLAAEIKLLSTGGIRPPMEELIPQFERASGHKVSARFAGGPAVQREAESGAAADVVIAPSNVIEELAKGGKVASGTRTEIARSGVGVIVRAGMPKPDISTAEGLKRALLDAKSIAYAGDGTAGLHFEKVLDRLGIRKQVEAKAKKTAAADPKNSAPVLVERGEVDLAVSSIPTIYERKGIVFAGPLPGDLQHYITYAGGVTANAKDAQAARAFLRFVTAPAAALALKAKGMEPAPQR
jgi:molybdate transport system substrate-binding protein